MKLKTMLVLVALTALQLTGLPTYAKSASPYTLTWFGANGGTSTSTGGDYRLNATSNPLGADAPSGGPYRIWNGPPLPILRNYLPSLLVDAPRPDLVGAFTLAPNKRDFKAGEPVTITAVITNQGELASGPFWVDLFANPTQPPDGSKIWNETCTFDRDHCFGIAWLVPGLAPGQSIMLTSTPASYADAQSKWPGWFAAGTTDLYLYVDTWNPGVRGNAVSESDETNNRAELHDLQVTGPNPATGLAQTTIQVRARPR